MEPTATQAPKPSTAKLSAALAKAQAEIVPPDMNKTVTVKTQSGASYTFNYADLAAITEAIKGPLTKHGISWTHVIERSGAAFVLVTKLMLGDEAIESEYPLPPASDPKAFGGAMTYGKRYSLAAITGCVAEDDADADPANTEHFGDRKPPGGARKPAQPATSTVSKPVVKGKIAHEPAPSLGANPEKPPPSLAERMDFNGYAAQKKWGVDDLKAYTELRWRKAGTGSLTRAEFDELIYIVANHTPKQAMAQGVPAPDVADGSS